MSRIKTGDTVKIMSGAKKGTTAKVVSIDNKAGLAKLEGIGISSRKLKPSQLNPTGGNKDVHVGLPLHKLALVVDEKAAKTSRVGYGKNADGVKVRLARQLKNKEIK